MMAGDTIHYSQVSSLFLKAGCRHKDEKAAIGRPFRLDSSTFSLLDVSQPARKRTGSPARGLYQRLDVTGEMGRRPLPWITHAVTLFL